MGRFEWKKRGIICYKYFAALNDRSLCCSSKCSGINSKIRHRMRSNRLEQIRDKELFFEKLRKRKCIDCCRSLINQKVYASRCVPCNKNLIDRIIDKYNKKINRKNTCIQCGKKNNRNITGKSSLYCYTCLKEKQMIRRKINYEIHKEGNKVKIMDEKGFNRYITTLLEKG